MTVHIFEHVWEESQHKGKKLLLMLALADNTDNSGLCLSPSLSHLQQRARLKTQEHVLEQLRQLTTHKTPELFNLSQGQTLHYRIWLPCMAACPSCVSPSRRSRLRRSEPPKQDPEHPLFVNPAWIDWFNEQEGLPPYPVDNARSVGPGKNHTKHRLEVWAKTDGLCWYCGRQTTRTPIPETSHLTFHIDHYQPRMRGGSHKLENLVPSCQRCNVRKHKRTVEEFRAFLQERGELDMLFWFEQHGLHLPENGGEA